MPAAAGPWIGCAPFRGCGGRGARGGQGLWTIPQKATECLFFLFFFLKNSFYSSPPVQTSTWPFTQPSLALTQESCSRSSWHWGWGCNCPGPCTGPRDLIVLKCSPYRLIFQCPLHFLVFNLHICWNTIGCSLCSSEDQLGISPVRRGVWTLLPLSHCHLPSPFLAFLKKNLLIDFREKGERETLICSTYLCIHQLIPVCVLTRDGTCKLGVLGKHSNQLSYPARAWSSFVQTFQDGGQAEMWGEQHQEEHGSSAHFPTYLALCISPIWLSLGYILLQ